MFAQTAQGREPNAQRRVTVYGLWHGPDRPRLNGRSEAIIVRCGLKILAELCGSGGTKITKEGRAKG